MARFDCIKAIWGHIIGKRKPWICLDIEKCAGCCGEKYEEVEQRTYSSTERLRSVNIKRGIFQRDNLSKEYL